jgi:pimeloyl-ACP methyl ester carboxylesterase
LPSIHSESVFAIDPAVARAFTPETLETITLPVRIVVGAADTIAPATDNAQFFAKNIRGSETHYSGRRGGPLHVPVGTEAGKKQLPKFLWTIPLLTAKPCARKFP